MGQFKKALKLFGSYAAPTGWGYLSGGYTKSFEKIDKKIDEV